MRPSRPPEASWRQRLGSVPTPAVQVGQGGRRRSGSCHAGPGINFVGHTRCIHTWQDFIYLHTVIDSCSKTIAGWAIENHMRVELVEHAWRHALDTTHIEDDAIFRSERGSL
jgi:transposase InsO family protein